MVRFFNSNKTSGIRPDNLLPDKSTCLRSVIFSKITAGISPIKFISVNLKYLSFVNFPNSAGISAGKKLSLYSKTKLSELR